MAVARLLSAMFLSAGLLVVGWDLYCCSGAGPLTTSVREIWNWAQRPDLWMVSGLKFPDWLVDSWENMAGVLPMAPAALVLGLLGGVLWLIGRGLRRAPRQRAEKRHQQQAVGARAERQTRGGSELRNALWTCRSAFWGTAGFSVIINILMLTGAVFMLEIYDRVLPSRSMATLIGLCIIASILFAAQGLLDLIRSRLLIRAGGAIDEALATRVFEILVKLPVRAVDRGDGLQPLRDLDAIRSFLSGPGPTALTDLPWLPFYLVIVYAFHPLLGVTALLGAIMLIVLTLLAEALSRKPARDATTHAMNRYALAEACRRNAEVLAGMGFASRLGNLWQSSNDRALAFQRRGADITGGLGAIARVLRMVLQSAVLAIGAYLVIIQQASAGAIIASSILAARALAPVDIAIANWRGFIAARQSWERLGRLLAMLPPQQVRMPLHAPSIRYQVENVIVAPPGEQKIVVRDVDFALNRGQGLGIIGPSGSGKSSLARVLVGAWLPVAGRVRLDGAALDQWAPEILGQYVGYLPQDVELFPGSVAQNIARFDPHADPDSVIKAARAADVHDLITSLPGDKGYETQIGERGKILSAGQRQRVALARALYGDPFLVVLDEPDASLDQKGEQALREAIRAVRARGGIVIVVSHRQTVLGAVDLLLALENGRPLVFGAKEIVLQKLARPAASSLHILKSLPDPGKNQS